MSNATEELLKKMRCKLCNQKHGKFQDDDLDGWVCEECRRETQWAVAHMKNAGIKTCTKAKNDTNGNRIGDNET